MCLINVIALSFKKINQQSGLYFIDCEVVRASPNNSAQLELKAYTTLLAI